jgi:hypothetical protein
MSHMLELENFTARRERQGYRLQLLSDFNHCYSQALSWFTKTGMAISQTLSLFTKTGMAIRSQKLLARLSDLKDGV